uniref:L-Fucosyltransferase n=1 Tax=Panagrellus redivivus TaxID=6233 RepID=A0A7E4VDA9_PANRE
MRAQFLILIEVIILLTYWSYTGFYILNDIDNHDDNGGSDGTLRFITCRFDHFSGLGNQLFRIASLYGIGQKLRRKVYFNSNLPTVRKAFLNFEQNFPNIANDAVTLVNTSLITEKVVLFGMNDRQYDNPMLIVKKTKYLKIAGNYIQSYKYFDGYQSDIKRIFTCQSTVTLDKRYVLDFHWRNEWHKKTHNLCVHTRRGDFLGIPFFRASSKQFTDPAVKTVLQTITSSNQSKVNVIYFGDDPQFVNGLYRSPQKGVKYFDMHKLQLTDVEELCFGIQNCDTVLLTATGSTFGWWLAYLHKKDGNVYYDGILSNYKVHGWNINDYVPSNWHRICADSGIAQVSHVPCPMRA